MGRDYSGQLLVELDFDEGAFVRGFVVSTITQIRSYPVKPAA